VAAAQIASEKPIREPLLAVAKRIPRLSIVTEAAPLSRHISTLENPEIEIPQAARLRPLPRVP